MAGRSGTTPSEALDALAADAEYFGFFDGVDPEPAGPGIRLTRIPGVGYAADAAGRTWTIRRADPALGDPADLPGVWRLAAGTPDAGETDAVPQFFARLADVRDWLTDADRRS